MSTMAKEKYRDEEHRQPPMCGGIVFSKFRPKVQDKKKRQNKQDDTLFKAFDQRPVMTDSRSATSSNTSSDESPASPETALLAEKSRSKRGSTTKLIALKDFVHATTLDLSSRQNQETLRAEFFMEEKTEKERIDRRESPAVEFDPNDVHQLRGKHIRSKVNSRTSTEPELDLFMNSAFPYSSKPPKSPKSSNKAVIASILLDQHDPMAQIPLPSPQALESPTWNTNVASQQKEAFDIISSQNIYYRNKLGNTQKSFRKLVKDQTNQADVIDKLKMEKETFQAETLLLREEMKAIRQQLDMFQKLLKQQQGSPTMTNVNVGAQLEEPKVSPRIDETAKEAEVTPVGMEGSTKEFPSDFPFVHPMSSNVEESEEKSVATDPAKNYWKREWELSMKEMGQVDHISPEKETADADDENSDPFYGISRLSPVNVTVAPVRGVDPPEVKRTSLHTRKSTLQKPSTPLHTERPEPNASDFPNKTKKDNHDYADDVEYVQQLMEKYKHQCILQEPSLSHDEPDLHESAKGLDEQEKIFEIENMADVDREYSQRQEEMARLRAAFERGELDGSVHDSRFDIVHPQQESRPGENKQSQITNMASIQSAKHGIHDHKFLDLGRPTSSDDFPAYPMPLFLRGMRLQEPTLPDPSEHGSATFESRQDDSGRSERSGMEYTRDVSQHSNDTEYADQIEHSTSQHHALLWSHSMGKEISPREEQRDPPPSKEFSHLKKSTKGERHVSLVDVMESEESSSEQTLAEVRDPGRNGRKGATYKIKMSSVSSQRQQNPSTSGNDEATMPTHQEPRGKAMPIHDRKALSRRLI